MDQNGKPVRFESVAAMVCMLLFIVQGCSSATPRWIEQPWSPDQGIETLDSQQNADQGSQNKSISSNNPENRQPASVAPNSENVARKVNFQEPIIRGQDPGYQQGNGQGRYVPPSGTGFAGNQYPQAPQGSGTTQQGFATQGLVTTFAPQQPGAPGVPSGYFNQPQQIAPIFEDQNFANIDVRVREAQTGRLTFGGAFNSNSGLVAQIIIDERNFDIAALPRSVDDLINGTAFRGAGQGFRLELVPGNEVQRYLLSFTEPYLFNSQVSFSASGFLFDRAFFDWDEQRLGGRFNLGYRLTPDLSVSAGLRLEDVTISDPRVATSPSLNAVLGSNRLFVGQVSLINDTRDHPFLASQGSYLELSFSQGFGDFSYSRAEADYRRHFLIRAREDGSGRHTFMYATKLGFSGSDTPVFENFFAGGFSTLRGFDFRGASPVEGGAIVGGRFQWLNTLEYVFPITADDMFKGVFFCDFGTVERDIEIDDANFRVAPGFGFRVHLPVGGAGGAPLAFDFAFPIEEAATDDRQVFSFHMSGSR